MQACLLLWLMGLLLLPVLGHAEPRELSSFTFGINLHRFLPRDYQLIAGLGNLSSRSDVLWSEVSNEKGVVRPDHPTLKGIFQRPGNIEQPLITLIYGHPAFDRGMRPTSDAAIAAYAAYAEAVVTTLKVSIPRFEVWNEWNVTRDQPGGKRDGKPEEYVALLREVFPKIKRHGVEVLGGAIGGDGINDDWLERALDAGLLESCDALSFHPYFYGAQGEGRLPEVGLISRLRAVTALLAQYEPAGKKTPLYITEMGWPTLDTGEGVTPEAQAKYLARTTLLLALEPQVHGLWIYELRDGPGERSDREQNFGLVLNDGTTKSAYAVMRDLVHLLRTAHTVQEVENESAGGVRILKFTLPQNREAWISWVVRPNESWMVDWVGSGVDEGMRQRLLGTSPGIKMTGTRLGTAAKYSLVVGDSPVIMSGSTAGSKLTGVRRREVNVDPAQ